MNKLGVLDEGFGNKKDVLVGTGYICQGTTRTIWTQKKIGWFSSRENETVQKLQDFAGLSFYLNLVTDTTKGIK